MSLPTPAYERDGITLYHGDCREVLATLPARSVHAVVTDPPYGIGFMGKAWDHGVPGVPFWEAIQATMLPGAYLLAFGGTRTFHRMAVAIEDAGFEIRDCLSWLYGSGFPKSLDVSKAIDKAAGAEREVIGQYTVSGNAARGGRQGRASVMAEGESSAGLSRDLEITAPATPEARQWDGWGTALKPSFEPIIMARKPFKGTVAANVLAHGTGALNIDASRIGTTDYTQEQWTQKGASRTTGTTYGVHKPSDTPVPAGRWPANVVLDEAAAEVLDAQSGELRSNPGTCRTDAAPGMYTPSRKAGTVVSRGDTGGASRFFYCAKASRSERNAGLDGMPTVSVGAHVQRTDAHSHRNGMNTAPAANSHPTVKPIDLMRWLVRMVTPPGGIVLDPFAGSCTTGCAVAVEGFGAILIEHEAEYVAIGAARIDYWSRRGRQLPLGGVA